MKIALTMYSIIEETEVVVGRYLAVKKMFKAFVIFYRIASWESSSLYNKMT